MLPLISFENVYYTYPKQTESILIDISCNIQPGDFITIVGPNGGGKSTFLKLLMGLIKPCKGNIQVCGVYPDKLKGKIGYVPQHLHFDPLFPITVEQVVLMGRLHKTPFLGRYNHKDREASYQALDKLQISALKNESIANLSGGQLQRVLIARALAGEPSILLLDESTSNIDNKTCKELHTLLVDLKDITRLLVTHKLSDVIPGVQKVFYLRNSLQILPPKDICHHFAMGVYHDPFPFKDPTSEGN